MEFKIHLIVITLSIFAFALIAVVEMPSTFENVLAQQREGNQEYSSISSSQQISSEDGVRESDRTPEVQEQRNSLDRSSQQMDEGDDRDLDRDRTPEGEEQRNSLDRSSQQIDEGDDRDLDRDRTPEVEE
jgi:hypothetical protein